MKQSLFLLKIINYLFLRKKKGLVSYQPIFSYLHKLAMEGKNFGNIGSIENSGELKVIELLNEEKEKEIIIFDVGANVGKYQHAILKTIKRNEFKVFCFEPSPTTFNVLKKNTTDSRVIINNFGLGDKKEELELFRTGPLSPLSSLYKKEKGDYYNVVSMEESEIVKIETLDEYCKDLNIKEIHFLKIDVEGHELNVLKGATRMLQEKRIKSIQLEFGPTNIDSRTYFRDFYNLLNDNFKFYRVLLDGLYEVKQYSEMEEVFFPVNYVAIRKSN